MSIEPTFSIVTPSLNQARYIEATIRSVLDQEGQFSIEYFIMDGGSTDGSIEIIKHLSDSVAAGEYPIGCRNVRVHWTSSKDRGQSDAINRGLRQASGDFAAYINSDDTYLPGAFAAVATAFEQDSTADIIFGDGEVIDQDGRVQWTWLSRPYDHSVMTSYHFLWNDFSNYIMQQATFWRRSVHGRVGLFEERFHFAMDVEYWIRAGASGLRLVHLPTKLACFRMIAGTKSLSGPAVFWNDTLEIYRRYRGTSALAPYLAFYFYNIAAHLGWDLDAARSSGVARLGHWHELEPEERRKIDKQIAVGHALAHFLVANTLQREGDYPRALSYLKRGLKHLPTALLRPLVFVPLIKQAIGPLRGRNLDRIADRIIGRYRAFRFDYRYQQERLKAE